jgi:hypothetical protein
MSLLNHTHIYFLLLNLYCLFILGIFLWLQFQTISEFVLSKNKRLFHICFKIDQVILYEMLVYFLSISNIPYRFIWNEL